MNIIDLDFITSPLSLTLKEYFGRLWNLNRISHNYAFEVIYNLIYAVNSMIKIGIPPPVLTPEYIYMSKRERPQILVPFFSKNYFAYNSYFNDLIRKNTYAEFNCFFVPKFYDKLNHPQDFSLFLRGKDSFEVSQLVKDARLWDNILKSTYYSLGLTITYILTNKTFIEKKIKKNKIETSTDFLLRLRNEKNFSKCIKNTKKLLKKYTKTLSLDVLNSFTCDMIELTFLSKVEKTLDDVLKNMSKELKLDFNPFNLISYNQDILLSNSLLSSQAGTFSKSLIRKSIYLSNGLTFNGYMEETYKDSAKYYTKNGLILNWNFNERGLDYECSVYLNDRSLKVTAVDDKLKDVKLTVKGGKGEDEKKIVMDKFYDNTWMLKREKWKSIAEPFIGKFARERNSKFYVLF